MADPTEATPVPIDQQFKAAIRKRGLALRSADQPPKTMEEWLSRKAAIRAGLLQAWGGFPFEKCDLEPKLLGTLQRDGYRIEKLLFQTIPGIWMTALAYVPDRPGKLPAVLAVHGHWREAKVAPVVQARCIGLARLGFFVLAVDAFGAGERGIETGLGEYHGEMVGALLLPLGIPLSGVQVYENMRAVDYLQSRPEVNPDKLAITGASGGGNQSMYAGAYDERFAAVVPVCSVGTYQAYLGAACCMCEVVPGAMTFTEEAGILSLVAPRALMIINASQDAFQFSIGEARKSIANAQPVFELYGKGSHLRHAPFEWHHDYSQAMRETVCGFFTQHLKGEGNGEPIPEKPIQTEEFETIRCFPNGSRPADYITLPRFAAMRGRLLSEQGNAEPVVHAEHWEATKARLLNRFEQNVFGGFPAAAPAQVITQDAVNGFERYLIETEPGFPCTVWLKTGSKAPEKLTLLVDNHVGGEDTIAKPLAQSILAAGESLAIVELRASGRCAVPGDAISRAPDHNTTEWSLWTGRPLLGQWVWDLRQITSWLGTQNPHWKDQISVIGYGPASLTVLAASAFETRWKKVALIRTPVTLVSDAPYVTMRAGILAPGVLKTIGDVSRWAALTAPRRLVIAQGVTATSDEIAAGPLPAYFAFTRKVYKAVGQPDQLVIGTDSTPDVIRRSLAGP